MNYEANKNQWRVGDMVLHDADAKRPEMLMQVVGYARDGRCQTRYASANQMNGDALRIKMRQKPEVWENAIRVLHDPVRFGVTPGPQSLPGAPIETLKIYVQSQQTKAALNGGVSTHKF